MKKQVIRLTEGDLHRIIENSVKKYLNEDFDDDYYVKGRIKRNSIEDENLKLRIEKIKQEIKRETIGLVTEFEKYGKNKGINFNAISFQCRDEYVKFGVRKKKMIRVNVYYNKEFIGCFDEKTDGRLFVGRINNVTVGNLPNRVTRYNYSMDNTSNKDYRKITIPSFNFQGHNIRETIYNIFLGILKNK